jgi:hypothetical protein
MLASKAKLRYKIKKNIVINFVCTKFQEFKFNLKDILSFSYPYPSKWGRYNKFSPCFHHQPA